ncbi:dTDP-4-dehydrorhamnose 3,5-epimerase family protein [Patescibacteria group bacterium]|nr:dTDP-4-dehydrorhamnose 3,5-epimerase family protein [Patescibacteria group bacterium]MCL5091220.1 dTDP-4-dehydrorhamnose 3,5-epimerase family protein [Patescibacteria group bacterium]
MQSSDHPGLLPDINGAVSVQNYQPKPQIDGVKVVDFKRFSGEDGTFEEMVRVDETGKLRLFPDFQLKQINRSRLLAGAIKAWHLHFRQEDIWYVPPEDHMLLGLWDVRADSPTKNLKMRIVMGAGRSQWVYIPRGVAHGVANLNHRPGTVVYLVNQYYDLNHPDEERLSWNQAGQEFWQAERG